MLVLLAVFATVAGQGVVGRWRGALIDERNKMSLFRLQMLLWTVVVVTGILAAALANIAGGQPSPLSIAIPAELWVLMGISTTSLVGSPLIRSPKLAETPEPTEEKETTERLARQASVDPTRVTAKAFDGGWVRRG